MPAVLTASFGKISLRTAASIRFQQAAKFLSLEFQFCNTSHVSSHHMRLIIIDRFYILSTLRLTI